MVQYFANPVFKKALASAAVNLLKVGTLTVGNIYLHKATSEAGKNLIAEVSQSYRLIKNDSAPKV